MSGHSKWANIKRQKGVNDIKRAQIFTKIARAITIAVQKSGGDPNSNPNLRLAMEKARAENMPKDNIERAIKKGTGGSLGVMRLEEAKYEGFGPNGVAILVDSLTDNKNRTTAEIRSIFTRFGGNLGGAGSTSYIFANGPENPSFTIPIPDEPTKNKIISLLEALDDHDDVQEVYSNGEL